MDGPTMSYLTCVNEVMHLGPAVLRWGGSNALASLQAVFTGDMSPCAQLASCPPVEVTNTMAQLAQLVLPGCDSPPSPAAVPASTGGDNLAKSLGRLHMSGGSTATGRADAGTQGGQGLLAWIHAAVFPEGGRSANLMHDVCYTTVLQAHQVRDMCLAALLMSVQPGNALALLNFAQTNGHGELFCAAMEAALSSPSEAVSADPAAMAALDAHALAHILQQDSLRMGEDEVLLLLLRWAETDATSGRQLLELAGSCVRAGALSQKQLEALDQHPMVVRSKDATMLVAGLYLSMIMGHEPLGGSRPRCHAASSAAALPAPAFGAMAIA